MITKVQNILLSLSILSSTCLGMSRDLELTRNQIATQTTQSIDTTPDSLNATRNHTTYDALSDHSKTQIQNTLQPKAQSTRPQAPCLGKMLEQSKSPMTLTQAITIPVTLNQSKNTSQPVAQKQNPIFGYIVLGNNPSRHHYGNPSMQPYSKPFVGIKIEKDFTPFANNRSRDYQPQQPYQYEIPKVKQDAIDAAVKRHVTNMQPKSYEEVQQNTLALKSELAAAEAHYKTVENNFGYFSPNYKDLTIASQQMSREQFKEYYQTVTERCRLEAKIEEFKECLKYNDQVIAAFDTLISQKVAIQSKNFSSMTIDQLNKKIGSLESDRDTLAKNIATTEQKIDVAQKKVDQFDGKLKEFTSESLSHRVYANVKSWCNDKDNYACLMERRGTPAHALNNEKGTLITLKKNATILTATIISAKTMLQVKEYQQVLSQRKKDGTLSTEEAQLLTAINQTIIDGGIGSYPIYNTLTQSAKDLL
ncbi:MAG: hypothetical protein NTX86_02130, partial [Candidatus Dependentiae bacterium]|nr:hypothetical protein [Candidatus Dependentiae bacterium]